VRQSGNFLVGNYDMPQGGAGVQCCLLDHVVVKAGERLERRWRRDPRMMNRRTATVLAPREEAASEHQGMTVGALLEGQRAHVGKFRSEAAECSRRGACR
jgi:hypothetical protein